ncbi:MBL fold metallo-hydrolase [Streptomyces acidiscabies]|uniref:MBL fold metallo-hydrolase n=1 Tax=Streptomyces acidiscabies TaxID=42234 RepID=UPI000951EC64|nr:MBL fold metallo-hydrolase [Streptomyces acidiscabies]
MTGRLTEVADRVFAFVQPDGGWCLNNAGIVVGADRACVVDTAATERRARALYAAVERVAGRPPGFLVNTHHHGDHTFGNSLFPPGTTVVSHDLARTEMADKALSLCQVWPDVDWGRLALRLPDLTFSDRLTLHLGDERAELLYVGPAHSTNDVAVWLPERGCLFAGDVLMSGCTPFCLMGSLEGSLRAVARLRALGAETVVCGHGPVCGPEVFDATERYLLWVRRLAKEGIAAGLDPLTTARESALGEYADLVDPERLVANLHRAYAEERGARPGEYLPSGPVFREMTDFSGGRPLRCLA